MWVRVPPLPLASFIMSNKRDNVIRAITTPLGFFALSLLIVEGFLGIVLVFSKGERNDHFNDWGMIIGAILFLVVVIGVLIIVWNRPKNLTLEGKHYKEMYELDRTINASEGQESATKDDKIINRYFRNTYDYFKRIYKRN